MGCLSHRKKQTEEFHDQKWEYISLNDFKAKGCGTPFAYGYLWFLMFLSIAFYAVDIFTAVNLLVFNRWASQVQPAIPFDILKYIFSVCIILSLVNLIYEGVRAYRVMQRGNVAECYLDSLAVRWESIRVGSSQGWRRFLVFAELTKSKKGAEYIALFTYFSFQSWIRVLLCSGPRQVVNALTLKSVYEARFAINNQSVEGSISEFFEKIKIIAEDDYRQAVILSGMCFTLVIWAFSLLFLIAAVLFYVFFLWHWIPRADGGLAGYCERKVNKALLKIVTKKVNKALAKGQYDRMKAELKAAKKNGEKPDLERMATLPTLPNVEALKGGDSLPSMPTLQRNDTMTTLPAYPGTPTGSIEMGMMDQKRPIPSRTATMASTATYSSKTSLTSAAADMGYARAGSPVPRVPDLDTNLYPLQRSGTTSSQRSMGYAASQVSAAPGYSTQPPFTESPIGLSGGQFSGPSRPPTARTVDGYNRPNYPSSNLGRSQFTPYSADNRSSLERTMDAQWDAASSGRYPGGPGQPPMRSATGPLPPRGPQYPPQRNMTAPVDQFFERPAPSMPMGGQRPPNFNRPGTAQSQRSQRGPQPPYGYDESQSSYGYDVESQRDRRY